MWVTPWDRSLPITTNSTLRRISFPIISMGVNDIKDIFNNVSYQDTATKDRLPYFWLTTTLDEIRVLPTFCWWPSTGKNIFLCRRTAQQGTIIPACIKTSRWIIQGKLGFFMYHNYRTALISMWACRGSWGCGITEFYELGSFGALNLTLNQSVMKRKRTSFLTFNDIFRTNKVDFAINQPGISASEAGWMTLAG